MEKTKTTSMLDNPELQQQIQAARAEYEDRNRLTTARRIGRIATSGLASGVILAHTTKNLAVGAAAKLAQETHNAITQRAEVAAPRRRRVGNLAVKASGVVVEALTRRANKDEGNLVSVARAHKESQAYNKQKAYKERQKVTAGTIAQYRAEHPEIAEQEQATRLAQERYEAAVSLNGQRTRAVEYFSTKNAESFAKAIPRRPSREGERGFTGDYLELAKASLGSALSHRQEDGSMPLLGSNIQRERIMEQEAENKSVSAIRSNETDYIGGVSTALWKLGFVNFESENNIQYGQGEFNPAVEWEKTENSVKARLAFDPTNELHQMLVTPEAATTNQMIELEMPQPQYGSPNQDSYLNMTVVEAAPVAVAA